MLKESLYIFLIRDWYDKDFIDSLHTVLFMLRMFFLKPLFFYHVRYDVCLANTTGTLRLKIREMRFAKLGPLPAP